jgi:hypothetical protein
MNQSVKQLVGRTISNVIVKTGPTVGEQVFLVFEDGTWFEIYSRFPMSASGSVHHGKANDVRSYMAEAQKVVLEFPSPSAASPA